MKKNTFLSKVENFYSKVYHSVIIVPAAIAEQYIDGKNKRVICHINAKGSFQGGLMPDGKGDYYITLSKEKRKKFDLGFGDEIEVRLEKDNSKYGLPMPEEMGALLEMDEEGNKFFHALTLGKQRNLLFMVGKPKNADTRLRKALVIVDYLKAVKGKLDFKELNEAFKAANKKV